MREIVIPFEHRYPEDLERIQRVLLANDYAASLETCAYLWGEYSDGMAAGWMMLPDTDEEVMDCIRWQVMKYTGELTPKP